MIDGITQESIPPSVYLGPEWRGDRFLNLPEHDKVRVGISVVWDLADPNSNITPPADAQLLAKVNGWTLASEAEQQNGTDGWVELNADWNQTLHPVGTDDSIAINSPSLAVIYTPYDLPDANPPLTGGASWYGSDPFYDIQLYVPPGPLRPSNDTPGGGLFPHGPGGGPTPYPPIGPDPGPGPTSPPPSPPPTPPPPPPPGVTENWINEVVGSFPGFYSAYGTPYENSGTSEEYGWAKSDGTSHDGNPPAADDIYMSVNDGYDDGNVDENGDPLPNNIPDAFNGLRADLHTAGMYLEMGSSDTSTNDDGSFSVSFDPSKVALYRPDPNSDPEYPSWIYVNTGWSETVDQWNADYQDSGWDVAFSPAFLVEAIATTGASTTAVSATFQKGNTPAANDKANFKIEPQLRLAWNSDQNGPGLYAYQIPLNDPDARPVEYDDPYAKLGGSWATIDWGDGSDPDDGSKPHFYEEGKYTVTISGTLGGQSISRTFQVIVGETENAVTPDEGSEAEFDWSGNMLTWDPVSGASSYSIYRGSNSSPGGMTLVGSTSDTEFDDASAPSNSTVYYQVVANLAGGGTQPMDVLAADPTPAATPPGASRPNLVTLKGTALPSDGLQGRLNALAQAKAEASQHADWVFVGIFDVVVTRIIGGNANVDYDSFSFKNLKRDRNNNWIAPGGYAAAKQVLTGLATNQRVTPTNQPNDGLLLLLQDDTQVELWKNGDWGTVQVRRPGEAAVNIYYKNPIKELSLVAGGAKQNIDRVDLWNNELVEEKDGRGLLNPVNLVDPATTQPTTAQKKLSEVQWADEQLNKTAQRIIYIKTQAFQGTKDDTGYVGPDVNLPSADDIRAIKKYVFEFKADWPAFRSAVDAKVSALRAQFPDYTFEVKYGVP